MKIKAKKSVSLKVLYTLYEQGAREKPGPFAEKGYKIFRHKKNGCVAIICVQSLLLNDNVFFLLDFLVLL